MNYQDKVAKQIKNLENPNPPIGPVIGKVTIAPPNLTISILEGRVMLYPDKLYMCENLWPDYHRKYKEVGSQDKLEISTTTNNVIGYGPEGHTHKHGDISGSGTMEESGDFWFTDTLKVNDKVLVIPATGNQIWFVVDRIRKVK